MGRISFITDDTFRGEGASDGLSRGLLAFFDSHNITQEGMGIGAIALRTDKFTYFSNTCKTEVIDSTKIAKTFLINKRLMKSFLGRPSEMLTWLYQKATNLYMALPLLQNILLSFSGRISNYTKTTTHFEDIEPAGEAEVVYLINKNIVSVNCNIMLSGRLPCKVYILNELGADFFHAGLVGKIVSPPPSGWQRLPKIMPTPSFYNAQHNVQFLVSNLISQHNVPIDIFWGREKTEHLCWAGFDFELDCSQIKSQTINCNYTVELIHHGKHN